MAGEVKQDLLFRWICNIASFAEGVERGLAKLDEMDRGLRNVEKATSFANRALSTFVGTLGVKVVEAATKAIGTLKQGFDRLVGLIQGAVQESARIEVQWRTLSLTAGNAGKSIGKMTEHVQALRAAGIKTSEALEIVTQFLANELPVENITELARRAQDMAVVIGRDSTEAFSRFNTFLQTGNSEWIRTMGITKTANQMLEEYAQTQGKVVKALTERERKEALVQGLMKETMRYEGAYEEAMKDPYKRWTSLPRLISNVTEVLGAVFVPMMGTVVDVFSDALEKIERLFRVTKKEAKETGATIGEWKEGFLKLRAVVTAFANWFMSIWKRVTGGFNEAAEGMMDRFVNAIIRGVKAAANALRRFAQFVASVFGGRAPAEVTAEAVARTRPEARPAPAPAAPAPTPEAATVMAAPETAAKLRAKPVKPAAAEDISKLAEIQGQLANLTNKLAEATTRAAKARQALARAEKVLEKASQRVYDIRTKIQRLEILWSEVPERFIRGRKRQLALELLAAEEEEREKKKAVDVERERLQLAEKYERQVSQMTEKLQREADKLSESIARQTEKYNEWLGKLQEAEAVSIVEPVQAVVDEFESLDDLTAGYLEEIQGELGPAFASIEESVKSIGSSLGVAWEKAKGIAKDVWDFLGRVKGWFADLPPWAQKALEIGALVLTLDFATGGTVGTVIKTALSAAFGAAKIMPGVGWAIIAGAIALRIALTPFLNPEVRQKWKDAFGALPKISEFFTKGAEAAEMTIQETPVFDRLLEWADSLTVVPEAIERLFLGRKDSMEAAVSEGIEKPTMNVFERLSGELVGASVVPEMVDAILGQFDRLQLDLSPIIDGLQGKLNILEKSFAGLLPSLRDFGFASGGNFQVTTIHVTGNTFGDNVDEYQIKDWMFQAIGDLL